MQRPSEGQISLLCLDLEAGSAALARYAWERSQRCDERLQILHVLPEGLGGNAAQAHRERLLTLLTAVAPEMRKCPVTLIEGIPDELIPIHARDTGVTSILLGRRHRPAIERLYVGSTTSAVICQAPCPILVVPLSAEPAR